MLHDNGYERYGGYPRASSNVFRILESKVVVFHSKNLFICNIVKPMPRIMLTRLQFTQNVAYCAALSLELYATPFIA